MKTKNILEITVDDLMAFFGMGRFASVRFIKNDGTPRVISAGKALVLDEVKGGEPAYDAYKRGQVRIFDFNVKDDEGNKVGRWCAVTASRVTDIWANNTHYVIG